MNSLYLAIGHELGAGGCPGWWDWRGDVAGGQRQQSGDVVAWRAASAGRDALGLRAAGAPGWPWEAVLYWESGFLGWCLCVADCSGPLVACLAGLMPASSAPSSAHWAGASLGLELEPWSGLC